MNAFTPVTMESAVAVALAAPLEPAGWLIGRVNAYDLAPVAEAPKAPLPPATALAERAPLTKALEIVSNAVERRSTIPILGNVLIEAAGDHVTVTGTDLDVEIKVDVPAAVDSHFAVTLPANTLKELLKKATASDFVGFTAPKNDDDESGAKVDFERVNYRLQTRPVADFPNLNPGEFSHSFDLPGSVLVESLGAVAMAISTEETRYYLNGVFMHVAEPRGRFIRAEDGTEEWAVDGTAKLTFVATDGHRLCRQDLQAPTGAIGMPGVIVPRAVVALLQKLLKGKGCPSTVKVEIGGNPGDYGGMDNGRIRLTFGAVTITSKLIDGTFPDYQRVIPTGNDKAATFKSADLSEGVRAVSLISSERGRAVKFTFDHGTCQLSVHNPDTGSAVSDIACHYDSEHVEIGFNASYLQDFIATADSEEITFTMSDFESPTLITGKREGWLGVQMPMRV